MKKHGIRGLLILALIWALIGAAWAEEMLPASIREAQSAEEANALLIQSDTGERLDVVSGQVRLIVQTRRDDMFCADYWRSGEEKGEFDLTAKENRYGHPAPETVQRLERAGCRIFYTMKSGAITLYPADGKKGWKLEQKFDKIERGDSHEHS